MRQLSGQGHGTILLLHGGAGGKTPKSATTVAASMTALRRIAADGVAKLRAKTTALKVVTGCLQDLEDHELFNAGFGAALQADGQARLTAALMNGESQRFSGVIGATHISHPSRLALYLQTRSSRVLASPGTELLARQLGLPVTTAISQGQLDQWLKRRADGSDDCDTVGCLLRTDDGQLFAGTSTGGRGHEFPGRVSDSATVAGTYASRFAAISATGIGEQIVDDAVAARIETRVRDGLTLTAASARTFQEATAANRAYGWIALAADGGWAIAHTTPIMTYVVMSERDGELAAS